MYGLIVMLKLDQLNIPALKWLKITAQFVVDRPVYCAHFTFGLSKAWNAQKLQYLQGAIIY